MSHQRVVAVYDTAAHADAAVNILKSAGYSADDISIIRNAGDASNTSLSEPGFWHRLFGREVDPHEARAYGQSVLQGGVVVWVRVPESEAPKVIELLNADQPVDVADPGSSAAPEPRVVVPPPSSASNLSKDEEVVRLAEERLNVGKREVVVNKTVRVAEEVVIRRKGSDRVETIHDTVRQQQVEIERVPAEPVKK